VELKPLPDPGNGGLAAIISNLRTAWENFKKIALAFFSNHYTSTIPAGMSFSTWVGLLGSSSVTVYINTTVTVSANLTIPSNISVVVLKGGSFAISAGATLTLNGSFEAGLFQVFSGSGAVAFGLGSTRALFPQWWGAVGDGVTNSTAGIQAALTAAPACKAQVRLVNGLYYTTDTLSFNSNQIQLIGDGPQNTQILFSEASKAALKIAVSVGVTREYWKIESLGFSCTGTPADCIAINASLGATGIVRDVWATNYSKALYHGDSYNTVVENARFVGCRDIGIDATANANDTCYLNCVVTCDNSANSRCMRLESNHGVSIKGGAYEDAEWGIELDATTATFDGYMESHNEGCFLLTGNETYLNILNAYVFNPGTTAVVKSSAGTVDVLVNQLRLLTPSTNPAYVFEMAGFASVAYGKVRADDAAYEPGGAQFASMTAGYLQRFTTPYRVTHYSNTANASEIQAATIGYAQKLNNPGGNGGLHIVAGNNKVNDGSELGLFIETGDGTDVLLVESGGKATLNGDMHVTTGDLWLNSAGKGIRVKEGSNARLGTATLVAGTVTVSNTSVTANTRIFYSVQAPGGTQGFLSVARVAGTSFTLTSTSATDTSVVAWFLVEPA
jgi:hypothetical protein